MYIKGKKQKTNIHFGGLDSLKVVHLSIRRSWFSWSNQQNQLGLQQLISELGHEGTIVGMHEGTIVGMYGETKGDTTSSSWSNEKYQENASDMQILAFG